MATNSRLEELALRNQARYTTTKDTSTINPEQSLSQTAVGKITLPFTKNNHSLNWICWIFSAGFPTSAFHPVKQSPEDTVADLVSHIPACGTMLSASLKP